MSKFYWKNTFEYGKTMQKINTPLNPKVQNNKRMKSEYISGNFRAWFFCKSCHSDVKDENLIKKCKCKHCKLNFKSFFAADEAG